MKQNATILVAIGVIIGFSITFSITFVAFIQSSEIQTTTAESSDATPIDICTTNTIQQREGKLGNLDAFMVDHCSAMNGFLESK